MPGSHDRAEALADQITQLRRELSLAEEGLASFALENKDLRDDLTACQLERDRIRDESLTWAMACDCNCSACTALYDVIRGAEPQSGDKT